jgi:hypothetical protein
MPTNLQVRFVRENAALFGSLKPSTFIYSCNISLRFRYVFIEVPKVACSSIKLTLQRAELDDPTFQREDFEDLHLRRFSPLLRPDQVGNLRRLLEAPDFVRFCFVRNPFTRLLSCYLDKIVGNRPQKQSVLRQLGRFTQDMDAPVTFAEFVDAVAAQPDAVKDPHWAVQWQHTLQGRIAYEMIGRYETFEQDFRTILDRIGIDHGRYHATERRHATSAARKLTDHYDVRMIEQVRRVYREDFEGFGYPMDLPA